MNELKSEFPLISNISVSILLLMVENNYKGVSIKMLGISKLQIDFFHLFCVGQLQFLWRKIWKQFVHQRAKKVNSIQWWTSVVKSKNNFSIENLGCTGCPMQDEPKMKFPNNLVGGFGSIQIVFRVSNGLCNICCVSASKLFVKFEI